MEKVSKTDGGQEGTKSGHGEDSNHSSFQSQIESVIQPCVFFEPALTISIEYSCSIEEISSLKVDGHRFDKQPSMVALCRGVSLNVGCGVLGPAVAAACSRRHPSMMVLATIKPCSPSRLRRSRPRVVFTLE